MPRFRLAVALLSVSILAAPLLAGSTPARAEDIVSGARTLTVDGSARTYLVHIPPQVARPAPVVLVFHGGGGRPQAIARKTGIDALADRHGFVAVYPAGAPAPSGRGGTWNVGTSNVGGPTSPSTADDVGFVRAILRDLERHMPIDHARIYAAGHSMGGVFAYRLACEMSDTFAAIAAVSATMVEPSCRPQSPVAILHIHGTDDERIPLGGGRGTLARRSWPAPRQGIDTWRQIDGCGQAPTRREMDGPATCTISDKCRATVEFCEIAGGTHPWPGGDARADSTATGPEPPAFPASQRIWAFFAAHPKRAP